MAIDDSALSVPQNDFLLPLLPWYKYSSLHRPTLLNNVQLPHVSSIWPILDAIKAPRLSIIRLQLDACVKDRLLLNLT